MTAAWSPGHGPFQHFSYAANAVPGYVLKSYLLGAAMRFRSLFVPESLSARPSMFVLRGR